MQVNSFKELPKIELHLHLDCSLSFDVVKQIDSNITLKDYKKLFQASPNCKSLKDYIIKVDPTVKGFNIGTNAGKISGQSIMHCHIHLIPRREGDVENPQGGVRSVIPSKQHYIRKNNK